VKSQHLNHGIVKNLRALEAHQKSEIPRRLGRAGKIQYVVGQIPWDIDHRYLANDFHLGSKEATISFLLCVTQIWGFHLVGMIIAVATFADLANATI
jgi:hypothetical protein